MIIKNINNQTIYIDLKTNLPILEMETKNTKFLREL